MKYEIIKKAFNFQRKSSSIEALSVSGHILVFLLDLYITGKTVYRFPAIGGVRLIWKWTRFSGWVHWSQSISIQCLDDHTYYWQQCFIKPEMVNLRKLCVIVKPRLHLVWFSELDQIEIEEMEIPMFGEVKSAQLQSVADCAIKTCKTWRNWLIILKNQKEFF